MLTIAAESHGFLSLSQPQRRVQWRFKGPKQAGKPTLGQQQLEWLTALQCRWGVLQH